MSSKANGGVEQDELDVRALGRALWRRKRWIVLPTLVAAVVSTVVVNLITPLYKPEARILYEGRENIFLRPDADKTQTDRGLADQEAVTTQVQVAMSRSLATDIIAKLKLNELPEFDPVLKGISPLKQVLIMAGLLRDPFRMTPQERVLESYYERLTVYPIERSRVLAIDFESQDPALAAKVANAVAEGYLELQQQARQDQTRGAGQWLASQIEQLRPKVEAAEAKAEAFRATTNLFVGTNNTTLSNQQLGEFNSQVAAAQAQKAEAETKARLIRDMLRRDGPIEASDILNSELIRRLSEQRVALSAQLAEQSITLLDGHPRIKELKAQIADLDRHIRAEAEKLARSLENDAKVAAAKLASLGTNLQSLKREAASTNEQDVQLRALEREARAQRDLLESYLAKYREASARESIGSAPGDARIISPAVVSNTPYFPKRLPTVLVATLATFFVSIGFVATGELVKATRGSAFDARPPTRLLAASHPELGVPLASFDALARDLRSVGAAGRRIAVFGASRRVGATLASVTLARALARNARTVLVDLALGAPNLAVISMDPRAPGIADAVRGTAPFGGVITRDRLSALHVIAAGRVQGDGAAVFASPRLTMMIEALARSYEHVVVDAGAVTEAAIERIHELAPRAVLVGAEPNALATKAGRERLAGAGFAEIIVLDGAPIIAADAEKSAAA